MGTIALTDEQRHALLAERGKPIDVIDLATQRRYVLLAQEQYERLCCNVENSADRASTCVSPVLESSNAVSCQPLRQRIGQLPLPPDVAAEANRHCTRLALWKRSGRRQMEERMKLQYYYGGKWIAYLRTNEGIVVVACASDPNDASFDQQLSLLTAEQRRDAVIDCPTRLFDNVSEVLTPFSHES